MNRDKHNSKPKSIDLTKLESIAEDMEIKKIANQERIELIKSRGLA